MNKLLLLAIVLLMTLKANSQTFGTIRAKNNAGTYGEIKRTNDALKVADSIGLVQITKAADSSYHRIMFKISQLPVVIIDSSYTRNSVKLNGTLPAFGSTPTFNIGTISTIATESTLSTLNGKIPSSLTVTSTRLLVDGSGVTQPVSLASVPSHAVTLDSLTQRSSVKVIELPSLPAGSNSIGTLGANSGVDIGDVTINNASGASAVNIQDGGNSITVDANTLPLPTGAATESSLSAVRTATELIEDAVNTTGTAVTAKAIGISGTDGTNARMLATNTAGALRLDSTYTRSSIKISEMPSVSVDSTTGSRITHKISELVPLVAGTAYIGKTRLTDGTTDAEVVPLAGYNAGAVAIVDGSGNQITSFGGGTQYAELNTTNPATGTLAMGRYLPTPPALNDEEMYGLQLDASGNLKVTGSFSVTAGATVIYDSTVTASSMTVTNLNSVANSATVGWQSIRVSNVSAKASDYKISVKLTMANTPPANDKAVYVYLCPHYTTDGGSTWLAASQGTTTLPTGSEGATTIASPNNLRLLGVLSYTTTQMVLQDNFLISNAFGNVMPDGFSIIIINYSGAAISASGNSVHYSPIYKTQR